MAGKRRNASLGPIATVPSTPKDNESVRIRAIDNGYIISRSGVKRGKYFEREEFSAAKPVISAAAPAPAPRKASAARTARTAGHIRPGSL